MGMKIYGNGDKTIWLPITKAKNKEGIRVFYPFNGISGDYEWGFSSSNSPKIKGGFFEAVRAIQNGYISKLEGKNTESICIIKPSCGRLSPSFGWIEVPVVALTYLTEKHISMLVKLSGGESLITVENISNFFKKMLSIGTKENRLFQNDFRKDALLEWGNKCILSGVTVPLDACHLKEVKDCKNDGDWLSMVDPLNSLVLQSSLHRLLDGGYFSFDESGYIIFADKFLLSDRKLYGIKSHLKIEFKAEALKYLAIHRNQYFPYIV
jgi:hypothetical protein